MIALSVTRCSYLLGVVTHASPAETGSILRRVEVPGITRHG
ncbi:hypothetical protein [Tessaracoccus coleopterorum]|nr:hypothetical protein [Tessaracoccus coleopterorum]